ncbi:MAG: hypothetical protein ACYDD4_04350 [Acidimicrobiales bacterium]
MTSGSVDELVAHLARSSGLGSGVTERLVSEVVEWFSESPEAFVRRRHRELQAEGLTNDPIFERVQGELTSRRFAAPALSARQMRRIVYG